MAQPKFKYRLQQVLEIKIREEEAEKEKLAKLLQLEEEAKQVKIKLEEKLVSVRLELRERQHAGTLDMEGLRFFPTHIKYLENQIVNQELRIKEIGMRIKEQRDNLMHAAQQRQTYEKHKENSQNAWLAEMDAKEATMLDELATLKYARDKAIS